MKDLVTQYNKILQSREVVRRQFERNLKLYLKQTIKEIKEIVGENRVIAGVSGGIDSLVSAILVYEAIDEQLNCVFINTGLLREGEAEEIPNIIKLGISANLHCIDASARFLGVLRNVTRPETKRRIIGEEFIRIFEERAAEIGGAKFLLQGTLYPDVIESFPLEGGLPQVKSHHNVGGLPEDMKFKLLEPLRYLYKNEVRRIAEELRVPKFLIQRQPFPGPGLAIRIIGPVQEEELKILRIADAIIREEMVRKDSHRGIWQFFGVLLPLGGVGAIGDSRFYDFTLALRIVASDDGTIAGWVRIPYEVLSRISSRVTDEIKEIGRVVYDISSKPPATIEWE